MNSESGSGLVTLRARIISGRGTMVESVSKQRIVVLQFVQMAV